MVRGDTAPYPRTSTKLLALGLHRAVLRKGFWLIDYRELITDGEIKLGWDNEKQIKRQRAKEGQGGNEGARER